MYDDVLSTGAATVTGRFIRTALLLVLAVAAAGAGARSPAGAVEQLSVRVGIAIEQASLRIGGDGPVAASEPGASGSRILPGNEWTVLPGPEGIDVSGEGFGPVVRLSPDSGVLRVEGRLYRGVIEIRRTASGRLTAIDEIELEAYLYGVIKAEVDPRWPPEAVKAQAVAARTLAVERMFASGGATSGGYDLSATTDDQVYLGVGAEDPLATAAVDATRALLVTYGGRPIFAAYHSNSGGHTEDSESVWGTVYPYLRGVPDPYVLNAPATSWSARLPLATVASALRRGGIDIPALDRVERGRATAWGRVVTVRLVGGDGRSQEINANRFRLLVGPGVVRSTMFRVARRGGDVEFTGRGAGHGVGLDQWGARAMAARGFSFDQILKYYYSGVTIEQRY
jgi:stage II sporulation protein D